MKVNQLNSMLNGMYTRRNDENINNINNGMSSSSRSVLMTVKLEYQR
jgi:hypothetical protein